MLLFVTFLQAQGWRTTLEPNANTSFNDIFFLTENSGWGAGDEYVAKTEDGGVTWASVTLPVVTDYDAVYFYNESIGFIGGADKTVFKTTDGGATWTSTVVDGIADKREIIEFHFCSETKGWMLTDYSKGGQVLSTTDGGATWTSDLTGTKNFNSFSFSGENKGVVVGSSEIYFTTDGLTWTAPTTAITLPPNYSSNKLYACSFTDENTVIATGWGSRIGAQETIYAKSTDGGNSWEYLDQKTEDEMFMSMDDMWFKDASTGYAVGGSSYEGSVIMKTIDGGKNWIRLNVNCGSSLKKIQGAGNAIYAIGSSNVLLKTTDEGNSWTLLTELPDASIYCMQVINDKNIYAGAFSGLFYKSTDSGKNWTANYVSLDGVCVTFRDIHFFDENNGVAVCSNRRVLFTNNAGNSWTEVLEDTSESKCINYDVHFVNNNLGFIASTNALSNGTIYKTTDGGMNWDLLPNVFEKSIYAIWFVNETHGVAAGYKGRIYYTTDGGASWLDPTINNVPDDKKENDLKSISFYDENNGFIVGKQIGLKTTDGGLTWEYVDIAGNEKTFTQVSYQNANTIYSLSAKLLYKTEDGTTWNDVYDSSIMTESLSCIDFNSNSEVWLGSYGGIIYTNASPTGIERIDDVLPADYELAQNYPNPFNPVTTIKYKLASAGKVEISVYNILGKLIKNLVNEYQTAGTYKTDFNASNLSSGVYFYRLNVNGSTNIKKMILMK